MSIVDTTAVKDSDIVVLRNFTTHSVGYRTPSTNVRRELPAGGSIKVSAGEIREMTYSKGCMELLRNYLQVCNKNLALEIGVSEDSIENEYNWTINDIHKCLLEGSLEELEDAMDFAPEGIKESLLSEAVNLEIPDVRKREVISKAMDRDVSKIIENKHLIEADTKEAAEKKTTTRRVTKKTTTTSKRRASTKKTAAATDSETNEVVESDKPNAEKSSSEE